MIVAEVDSMHGNVENNSKKSKKSKARVLDDGHDNEVNGRHNETVDEIVDASIQMEISQKQRKNKRKFELNEKEADFTNAQMKMSSNLSREDKKKRKKKHERDRKHDEARVLRGILEVNSSLQEKQPRNCDSDDYGSGRKNQTGGEACLRLYAESDGKEKTHKKQKRLVGDGNVSSSMGIVEGQKVRSDKVIESKKSSSKDISESGKSEVGAKEKIAIKGDGKEDKVDKRKKKTDDRKGVAKSEDHRVVNVEKVDVKKRKRNREKKIDNYSLDGVKKRTRNMEKKIDKRDLNKEEKMRKSMEEEEIVNRDLGSESNVQSTPSNSQDRRNKKDSNNMTVEEKQLESNDLDGESNADSTPSNSQVTVDKKDEKSKKKKKKKKKKAKSVEEKKIDDNDVDGESNANSTPSKSHDGKKRKKSKLVDNGSENPKSKGRSKRVSFSGHVEVFPSSDTDAERGATQEDDLVRGKRFTPEEDKIIKEAVESYIEERGLGENGLNMVLHCGSHREVRNCWRHIGAAIPYRPYTAICSRAHILYERSESREWTEEETAKLLELQKKYGNCWKMAAEELGKSRLHLKDKWRGAKSSWNKGHWSQEEYQKLYDLVNIDLQMRAAGDLRRSKYGMIRDDISWTAISDKLCTRSTPICCLKWYNRLTSSMVVDGLWCDTDDYRLVRALYEFDATCMEDVDWDNLLEHRDGDVCRKRWGQMVLHIGHHGSKPFAEQVEILAERYCPDLVDAREAWDSKPVVN